MLGPLTVDGDDGVPLPVTPTLPRTVLAMLVTRANTVVPADRLIEAMWPRERQPAAAPAALYNHMRRLRQLLGPLGARRIRTTASGYVIEVHEQELDLSRFHQYHRCGLAAYREGQWFEAQRELTGALKLWRGDPLADIVRPVLAESEYQRLHELRLQALQWRIEAALQLGQHESVLSELQALTVEHPYLEAFHGQLMLALHRFGRRADALGAYRRILETLQDELGVEPGAPLQELHQRILLRDPDLSCPAQRTTAVSSAALPPVAPAHWPEPVGGFLGRSEQLAALDEWSKSAEGYAASRPVAVLTGMSGVGKTALARHASLQMAERFPDGVLYADLRGSALEHAPVVEVLAGLLRDLGTPFGSVAGEVDALAPCFRSLVARRRMLLVLDDAANAEQVAPLLPGDGRVAVLVTSRTLMTGLAHAHRITLEGLPERDAVQLLTHIVGDRRTNAEPQAVRQVVGLCDGLPLAVRVAGLRLAARPSWQIAAFADVLVEEDHRLGELAIGQLAVRDHVLAQYRQVAEGSPDGSTAAQLFRLSALWQGPDLSLPAVAALAGFDESICAPALERLVEGHLMRSTGPGRYGLRGLPRLLAQQLAAEQDGPALRAEALHRLHSWYHHTAEAAANALDGQRPGSIPGHLVRSRLRALAFALPDQALRWQRAEHANLIASVRQVDRMGHHCFSWLSTTAPHGPHDERTVELIFLGHYEEAMAYARHLAAQGVKAGLWRQVAAARSSLAEVLRLTGRYRAAESQATSGLALARSLEDMELIVALGLTMGRIHCAYQDTNRALTFFREALDVATRASDHAAAAQCVAAIGDVHASLGEMDAAGLAWRGVRALQDGSAMVSVAASG